MPQFRGRPGARSLTPAEITDRTYCALATGLDNTEVSPGQPAEITADFRIRVLHEENGAPKDRCPGHCYVPAEVVSRLLACHEDQDYERAFFEFEEYLSTRYIPGCELLFVGEFSMYPVCRPPARLRPRTLRSARGARSR